MATDQTFVRGRTHKMGQMASKIYPNQRFDRQGKDPTQGGITSATKIFLYKKQNNIQEELQQL